MALTEQEELELLELEAMEAGTAAAPPRSAAAEIKAKHAKNVAAEQAIYKPSLGDVWTQGYNKGGAGMALAHTMGEMGQDIGQVLKETPNRLGGMVSGMAGLTTAEPGAPMVGGINLKKVGEMGQQVPEMIRKGTEPLISPRTFGKAGMEMAVDTALTAGITKGVGAGVGAAKEFISQAPQRALKQGTQQIMAGLKTNVRTAEALKSAQGNFGEYISKTGRQITDSKSAASIFKDATDDFYKTNYQPLVNEIESVPIEHAGQMTTPTKLLERRAEINDTLGRIGYYDKNPMIQSYARSSPQVQALLEEADSVRGALNKAVDTMTPTNAKAANILRKYADMKQVSDMSKIRAQRIGLAKDIKAGEAAPLGERALDLGKDMAVTLGTLGMNPRLINRWVQAATKYKARVPDPDILFKRGGQNWQRGAGAAAEPIPVKKVPIEFPKQPVGGGAPVVGEAEAGAAYGARRQSLGQQQPDLSPAQLDELMRSQSIPGVGQTQMPFAPPGVGAMGSELPNRFDPLQSQISMPNALSQRFSRTPPEQAMPPVTSGESAAAYQARQQSLFEQNPNLTPDELVEAMRSQAIPSAGQEFLPFVESRIGGEPQSLGGIQGTQGQTFPNTYGPPDPRIELLRNAGAPLPPEMQNVLSPHFQPNPLLNRDVVAQSRAQSTQGPNRLSMGEAAISGQEPPLSSFLNYQGADPRTIRFDENFVRTAQSLQMTPEQLQQLLRQMP